MSRMSINQTVGSPPIVISQLTGRAQPTITPILIGLLVFSIATFIILTVGGNLKIQKQKKTLASTVVYGSQLLSLKGEAQRYPWKDRIPRYSSISNIAHFCNKISLTIKNEGSMPIDTAVYKQPIAFNLNVRGKLEDFGGLPGVELLDVKPANTKLELSLRDGQALLNHVHLDPGESLQLMFLGYFTGNL